MSDLTSRYPITTEQVAQFTEQGFMALPQALSTQTLRKYEPEITSKVFELNTQHLSVGERATAAQRAALQVMNLWQHSNRVREFVFSPRLAQLAVDLLGVRAVRLYHDQAIYKGARWRNLSVARRPVLLAVVERSSRHRTPDNRATPTCGCPGCRPARSRSRR